MEEYLKQNMNRHKSEKGLDKFLYREEKVNINIINIKKESEILVKKLEQC